ncbi:cadherin repeat domain-containing protein, partial [bacterium c-19]|nr:cadherin repeat domain-containing protein [bacterium c-19]
MVMRKKILIISICLVSSILMMISSKGIMKNIINAQSAPAFRMPKGSKVVLGKYNSKEVVWDIGNNDNNGSYVLMSSKPIDDAMNLFATDSGLPVITSPAALADRENAILKMKSTSHSYCPVTPIKNKINQISLNRNDAIILIRIPFLPSVHDVKNGGNLGLSLSDRAYSSSITYWIDGYLKGLYLGGTAYMSAYHNASQKPADYNLNDRDVRDFDTGEIIPQSENIMWSECQMTIYQETYAIRPFAMADNTKIMFAANTSYTDGSWHSYTIDTANLNENNELNPNKLRIQSSLTASLLDIKRNNHSIQKVAKNQNVDLSINANTGTNTKMSVILYDDAGTQIQYYKLGSNTQNGTNDYTLDLTGIPIGKYQVAVINEEYDASSNLPVESSAISDLMPLEIVEPHKLTYTKTPQSGASAGNDYEFSKNVNAGQAVGKITVNPQGVMPLTYTVETNGDNTYQNFEVDGLNSSGASSSTSLNVKIKSAAPDLVNGGLKAGTYKFCVSAKDANGDPTTATSDSKVCTSFTVEKTDLSIAFNDPTQTKKSISDAATAWSETASATPSTGTKITYSVSGGDISLISINPDTGAITYTGSNALGKVKIKATVDDDPTTGDDNYNSAFVEKEIVIYREVDGSVTPHSNSSDTTTPTFTASDSNISTGGIIGTIHGTLGTPDTIGGTTTTYHYGLKPGVGNASFFSVDANTGVIKTTANLGVNSYHITVTVSDNWSRKEIPVTINVGVAAAEDLKFYENSTSTTAITTKSAALTDTGVVVYATVRGSSNTNPVKYSIQDGSTNVIEVNENSGAVTIHGVGTVTIVAKKQGAAGQA